MTYTDNQLAVLSSFYANLLIEQRELYIAVQHQPQVRTRYLENVEECTLFSYWLFDDQIKRTIFLALEEIKIFFSALTSENGNQFEIKETERKNVVNLFIRNIHKEESSIDVHLQFRFMLTLVPGAIKILHCAHQDGKLTSIKNQTNSLAEVEAIVDELKKLISEMLSQFESN